MSGSTIGGFIGGAIGFWFGGPQGAQRGFMIGSAVGGYVDPEQIEGPRLNDAQTQSSTEGVPRPIIYGTAAVSGNIIQCGPLVEHKTKKRQGKGGPEVTTYTYTRTVAIRICEAAPLGGEMKLRRVWMDDKLVYDASGSGVIDADSATFKSILQFYSGSETQLPDPSLEALPAENGGGVGNVPAYRGTCYAVLTDLDCTDRQGAVPQFRWEVCSDATEGEATGAYLPMDFAGISPWRADASGQADPRKNGVSYQYASVPYGSSYTNSGLVWRNTVEEALADKAATAYGPTIGTPKLAGWAKSYGGGANDVDATSPFDEITDFEDRYVVGLIYTRYDAEVVDDLAIFAAGGVASQCSLYLQPYFAGHVVPSDGGTTPVFRNATVQQSTAAPAGSDTSWSCYDGGSYNNGGIKIFFGYVIACRPVLGCYKIPTPDAVPIPDAPGFYLEDGEVVDYSGSCTVESGTFKQLSLLTHSTGGTIGGAQIDHYPVGPVLSSTAPEYSTKSFWDAEYAAAVAVGSMPAGLTYSSAGTGGVLTYPRSTSSACVFAKSLPPVTPGTVPLSSIVADLADRVDVASDQIDVSALASIPVRGFPVSRQTSPAEAIRSLQQVFFFDFPEWGNSGDSTTKLRAVLRGGAVRATITDADLVDTDDDEDTRPQVVEFPRKVSLTSADPESNYDPVTQAAEIDTENVKAVGEISISTAVVLTRDENAVVVDKVIKTTVEEATGKRTLELPEEFSQYTPSDIVSYQGRRLRIDKVERVDGTNRWELIRDRASANTSVATGSPAQTPAAPVSSTRGPTMFAALNLPRLRSQDTTPGMYVAVCGLLPGWIGCDLYLSVDDGVTEQLVATILEPSTMGTLTAALAAAGATASVALYDGELDSATVDQLLARLNAAAVTTAGVSEILQFQTATDTGTEAYDLTDLSRGVLGTTAAAHVTDDSFVLLDAVQLIPLDVGLAGKTLIFRPVSRGTAVANNPTYSVVFKPQFTGPQVVEAYTDAAGNAYTDDAGNPYYYEVPST